MAETATKTGAPARTRKPAAAKPATATAKTAQKAAPATKTATKAPAAAKVEEAPPVDLRAKTLVAFDYAGDTKNFAKFSPPEDSGCAGTVYVPLGTEEVRVLLISGAEEIDAG